MISAALVIRLETREMPFKLELAWVTWQHRPSIEIALSLVANDSIGLRRKLDEVYPF